MFMQVVRGKVADEAAARARFDAWESEVKPVAIGYLGATGGFLDDGGFVIVARFDSEENAQRNSDLPEQSAWWEKTASVFDGEAEFINCTEVETWLGGGSDSAGFVQVMIGHSPDRAALREMTSQEGEELSAARPDIIGGVAGNFGDNGFVNVGYFTSEAEARKGESSDGPPEADEFQRLMGEVEFLDLHKPFFYSE